MTELRGEVMTDGRRCSTKETLDSMAQRCRGDLSNLPSGCLRLINPHRYKVSISNRLKCLRENLLEDLGKGLV
jgi:nicotinate phosphoribosyltransferase